MEWRVIPDFADYEVSEIGEVRRGPTRLKPEMTGDSGRKRFSLSKGGRLYRFRAHQLVALAFLGPRPFKSAEVCHRDGFEHNNHYSNLRWGTHASNIADTMRHRVARKFRPSRKDFIAIEAQDFLANGGRKRRSRGRYSKIQHGGVGAE